MEFGKLTPALYMALMARKGAEFRRQRYAAAMPTAMLANVNRGSEGQPVSPFDFIEPLEDSARDEAKNNLVSLFSMIAADTPPEQIAAIRERTIKNLSKDFDDAQAIFEEVFSAWKDEQTT